MKNIENRLKNIANLLKTAEKNLGKASKLLDTFIEEVETSFEEVPGVLGIFDGTHMVDANGKRYEINPNYIAKSLLISGDNLKMVENEKKEMMFKQISKVARKKLTGILNKKEGKWYALTDAGSYKILDVAVAFRQGEINDEVTVLVPEDNLNVEWAALESMAKDIKEKVKVEKTEEKPIEVQEISEEIKPVIEKAPEPRVQKGVSVKKPASKPKRSSAPKVDNRPVIKPPQKAKSTKGGQKKSSFGSYESKNNDKSSGISVEEVNTLLGDDDLR